MLKKLSSILLAIGLLGTIGLVVILSPNVSVSVSFAIAEECVQRSEGEKECVVDVSLVAGTTAIVTVSNNVANTTVLSITDDGSNIYVQRVVATNGGDARVSIWTTAISGIQSEATEVTIRMSADSAFVVAVGAYLGAFSFGSSFPTNAGNSNTPTLTHLIENADNWLVGGFVSLSSVLPHELTGNLRAAAKSPRPPPTSGTLIDNTATTVTQVTIAEKTGNKAGIWVGAAVELVSVSAQMVPAIVGMSPELLWEDVANGTLFPWTVVIDQNTWGVNQTGVVPIITVIANPVLTSCSGVVVQQSNVSGGPYLALVGVFSSGICVYQGNTTTFGQTVTAGSLSNIWFFRSAITDLAGAEVANGTTYQWSAQFGK